MLLPEDELKSIVEEIKKLRTFPALKRILITGASGFMGNWLVQTLTLLEQTHPCGIQLFLLTRSIEKYKTKFPSLVNITFINLIEGDMSVVDIPKEHYDIVFHTAIEPYAADQASRSFAKTLPGVMNLSKQLLVHSPDHLMIYFSSGAVYGKEMPSPVAECETDLADHHLNLSENSYGSQKWLAEEYLKKQYQHSPQQLLILRIFSSYGPGMNFDSELAITQFIKEVVRENQITLQGDGTPRRSYCYIVDLIKIIFHLIINGKWGAYNVATSSNLNLKNLAQEILNLNHNSKLIIMGQQQLTGSAKIYLPDLTKLHLAIGQQRETDLSIGLGNTMNWYKKLLAHKNHGPIS